MHVNFKRLTQMLKRGHYNHGILLSNYKRTKIEERSVIVMLLSQVFWSSGACFCLLNTGHLNLLASSPYGDTVKSRRARSTPEETRKLCRSLARFLAACFARPNRRDCSQATNSSHVTVVLFVKNQGKLSRCLLMYLTDPFHVAMSLFSINIDNG